MRGRNYNQLPIEWSSPAGGVDKTDARSKLQSTSVHCRCSNLSEGVDKTNSRSKLQSTVAVRIPLRVLTAVHLGRRGSNPAEGVDKTNARSKLQTTGA
ncbi:unnamed protein product [Protopolystoma xenopodis]|uniref:Uncharacterized protein n=1 Tax=Protopolystoma xenopodis TaxID=117903 RepID=A0A3S5AY29_9PLAT|nr:unnamed protein product [Protopolystoma xenopodis]